MSTEIQARISYTVADEKPDHQLNEFCIKTRDHRQVSRFKSPDNRGTTPSNGWYTAWQSAVCSEPALRQNSHNLPGFCAGDIPET